MLWSHAGTIGTRVVRFIDRVLHYVKRLWLSAQFIIGLNCKYVLMFDVIAIRIIYRNIQSKPSLFVQPHSWIYCNNTNTIISLDQPNSTTCVSKWVETDYYLMLQYRALCVALYVDAGQDWCPVLESFKRLPYIRFHLTNWFSIMPSWIIQPKNTLNQSRSGSLALQMSIFHTLFEWIVNSWAKLTHD